MNAAASSKEMSFFETPLEAKSSGSGTLIHISRAKYRKLLLNGKRKDSPCNKCNAQGTLLGQDHAKIWRAIYNC